MRLIRNPIMQFQMSCIFVIKSSSNLVIDRIKYSVVQNKLDTFLTFTFAHNKYNNEFILKYLQTMILNIDTQILKQDKFSYNNYTHAQSMGCLPKQNNGDNCALTFRLSNVLLASYTSRVCLMVFNYFSGKGFPFYYYNVNFDATFTTSSQGIAIL